MIEFVTLYLGLVAGIQPLEVSVGPEVASVEILLDGEAIAGMTGPPWRTQCDFGPRLLPHRLEAVARDMNGTELARADQWINLPRPRAEAKLALEADEEGERRWARVVWEAIDFDEARRTEVHLDGKRLDRDETGHFVLPRVDPATIHLLTAEVEFSDTVETRAELVFGGTYGDTVATELTSIVLETDRGRPPNVDQLQGLLLHRGRPLRVVAVERPPVEIVIVREHSAGLFDAMQRLVITGSTRRNPARAIVPSVLHPADRVRHALGGATRIEGSSPTYEQIPVTGNLARRRDTRLIDVIKGITTMSPQTMLDEERIADTVAVAGLVASASNRRRVVVLLSAFENAEVSRLVPAAVRDYLNSMMVPLVVWRLTPPGSKAPPKTGAWGAAADVSDWGGMGIALRRLEEMLDSQFLVWVEGRYLQREITVSAEARKVRLAQRQDEALAKTLESLPHRTVDSGPTSNTLQTARSAIDTARLELARRHLGAAEPVSLGPVTLLSDGKAPRLWKGLERTVNDLPALYAKHFQIDVALDAGALVALFDTQTDYEAYERELGMTTGRRVGHASPGFVALYAGERSNREIIDTFTHELAHLLNLRALGPSAPVWLDEGLAGAMAFATRSSSGELDLAPLDPRRIKAAGGLALRGPMSILPRLIQALETDRLPTLRELEERDRASFDSGEDRQMLYALSALWAHYLGVVDAESRSGFRGYLHSIASTDAVPPSVHTHIAREPEALEAAFRLWLQWLGEELAELFEAA